MSSRPVVAVLLAALISPPSTALGQAADTAAPPLRSEMRRACAADYQRFCAHVRPGSGALRQCFTDHAADLSSECLQVLQRVSPTAAPGSG